MKDISKLVIHEDNHLIAINKPSGLLVQGDKTGDITLLQLAKLYIKEKYNKPGDVFLNIIHRLDRPTSGCVIFARTSKATSRMNVLFKERKMSKQYLAISRARPNVDEGSLEHYLKKNNKSNIVTAFDYKVKEGKQAILDYKLLNYHQGLALIQLNPLTGRSHQIRVQLKSIGAPIMGDLKYGAKEPLPNASIALHCHVMEFIHPVSKTNCRIMAKPPKRAPWNKFDINIK